MRNLLGQFQVVDMFNQVVSTLDISVTVFKMYNKRICHFLRALKETFCLKYYLELPFFIAVLIHAIIHSEYRATMLPDFIFRSSPQSIRYLPR